MKTSTLFLVIASLFLMGCNNNDDGLACSFPVSYHFYIELKNTVDEMPGDGEVTIFYPNYFASSTDVIELVVVDDIVSDLTGKTLFGDSIAPDGLQGIRFGGSSCSVLNNNVDHTETLTINYNENTSDTLTIRRFGFRGDSFLKYEFRLNGNLLELYSPYVEDQIPNPNGGDIYFTIVKDIEWENTQDN